MGIPSDLCFFGQFFRHRLGTRTQDDTQSTPPNAEVTGNMEWK
jgi:hypothetical protein